MVPQTSHGQACGVAWLEAPLPLKLKLRQSEVWSLSCIQTRKGLSGRCPAIPVVTMVFLINVLREVKLIHGLIPEMD